MSLIVEGGLFFAIMVLTETFLKVESTLKVQNYKLMKIEETEKIIYNLLFRNFIIEKW